MAKPIIRRPATQKDVPLGKMAVLDIAQRRRDDAWVRHLLDEFDIDQIGFPIVSQRAGNYNIIDGQHRIEALKLFLGEGWERQLISCKVYHGLTEAEEAELFLRYNDVRQVRLFDKFHVGVTARRAAEVEIKRVVEGLELKISANRSVPGSVSAVGVLHRVYKRSGSEVLHRSLRIIRDAYGDPGFDAHVIAGISLVCNRYNGALDDEQAVQKLGTARGGVRGLLNRAEEVRLRTNKNKAECVAAAAVDIINSRRGGNKLPSWWGEQ